MDKTIPQEILAVLEWTNSKDAAEPARIKHINQPPKQCEGCNRLVQNRTVRISLSRSTYTAAHQKQQCQICKNYLNPRTGEWDATFHQVNSQYTLNKKQRMDK